MYATEPGWKQLQADDDPVFAAEVAAAMAPADKLPDWMTGEFVAAAEKAAEERPDDWGEGPDDLPAVDAPEPARAVAGELPVKRVPKPRWVRTREKIEKRARKARLKQEGDGA